MHQRWRTDVMTHWRHGVVCRLLREVRNYHKDGNTVLNPMRWSVAAIRSTTRRWWCAMRWCWSRTSSQRASGLTPGAKLAGYFRLPSLRYYLMVDPGRRTVVTTNAVKTARSRRA